MHTVKTDLFSKIGRVVVLPLSVFALTVLLTVSYIRGTQIEVERDAARNTFETPKLHYGDPLPDFRLSDTTGKIWMPSMLAGHWTILSFTSLSCSACRSQLSELQKVLSPNSQNKIIAVVSGAPLLRSFDGVCKNFASELRLNFPLLEDSKGELLKNFCGTKNVPFTLLLDPQGRVRSFLQGFEPDAVKSQFRAAVEFRNISLHSTRRPFPINGYISDHGTRRQLKDIIGSGWTVLTFASVSCSVCNERAVMLSRFHYTPQYRSLLMFSSREEAAQEEAKSKNFPLQCIASPPDDLPKKFNIHHVPKTFIFYNGSLAYAEEGISSETVLWNFLGAINDKRITSRESLALEKGEK